MLKLPPPIWALAYMLIGAGASYLAGWPRFPGLPLIWLGVALIVLGIALAGASVMLFRREGTEVNPTSPTNRKLVTSGPFRVTRNPMYLGLIIVTVGVAFGVGAWPMFSGSRRALRHGELGACSFEEEKMRRQFGGAFDAYAQKVRRWI